MDTLTVTITDATGSKQQAATIPRDAPVIRVVARVVQAMGLPINGPDGQPLSYKFHSRDLGRQLRDDETFQGAGVGDGDSLRLVAEITAG